MLPCIALQLLVIKVMLCHSRRLYQQQYKNLPGPGKKNARVDFSCVQGGYSTGEKALKNPRSTDKNEKSQQTIKHQDWMKISSSYQVLKSKKYMVGGL